MNSSVSQLDDPGLKAAKKRCNNLCKGLLLSAATVVLFLGILELVGYVWEQRTADGEFGWSLVASRRLHFERKGEDGQTYYLFEPGRRYEWRGITVEINSRGLRDGEYLSPKPADTFRILNVGDSIAFGWELKQEDTYGKQLEARLNSRGDGRQYEVINAAVPTWNLEAERNFLIQEGMSYEPDLILLDLTIVNDIRGKGPESLLGADTGITGWLRENTYGWPFMTTQARFFLARQKGPQAFRVLNPPVEASKYFPLDAENPTWDQVWQPIFEMSEAAREEGIPLIVVAFPTAYQLSSYQHPDVPQQVLGERAAEAEIPFVDLLPTYEEACQEAGPSACEGYQNLLFVDVWMHPNVLGHELASREIEKVITSYLPAD
jgi:hypothetical protein